MIKHILPLVICLVAMLSATSCASKKYAKRAQKLADAGMYSEAAQMYYQSVAANGKNVEAKVGLKRFGQMFLQDKIANFKAHYNNKATKDAVYAYLDAQNYYNQVRNVGVSLVFPAELGVQYAEVRDRYLLARYNEGMQALKVEDFADAESAFGEILNIDESFKDSRTQYVTARYEPIYRQAAVYYRSGKYRTAYGSYDLIIAETGGYKDAVALRTEALNKATVTIAVIPFFCRHRHFASNAQLLRTKTINELNNLRSPFYKVVTDNFLNSIPLDGANSQVRDILVFIAMNSKYIKANTILTGSIVKMEEVYEPDRSTNRPAYVKRIEETTDPTTGAKKSRTVYDKVTYQEHTAYSSSAISFEYALVDVKSRTVLVTDVINLSGETGAEYATFQGDAKKLIPGYWKDAAKQSAEDVVNDSNDKITEFQNRFTANRQIKTARAITEELIAEAAHQTAMAIERYNPER